LTFGFFSGYNVATFSSRRGFMRLFLIGLLWLVTSTAALACEKCEVVVEVIDGDTVVVMCEGKAKQVHLTSVDAPQMQQPYGKEAKTFTENLMMNHVATINYIDNNRAADITSSDGKSLKWGLIRAGLAWYPPNHQKNTLRDVSDKVGKYERKARRARKGLWAQNNPQPPWQVHQGTEVLSKTMASMGNVRLGGIVG
jgi:endonuclease YncB( thermonuclease family)